MVANGPGRMVGVWTRVELQHIDLSQLQTVSETGFTVQVQDERDGGAPDPAAASTAGHHRRAAGEPPQRIQVINGTGTADGFTATSRAGHKNDKNRAVHLRLIIDRYPLNSGY